MHVCVLGGWGLGGGGRTVLYFKNYCYLILRYISNVLLVEFYLKCYY